jgi:two-component system, NarL family, nitrate/nitrite response regulator NarL
MQNGDPVGSVEAMALHCVVVDDNPAFVAAARSLLEREGMIVLGVAANGAEALRLSAELRPDVLLVDIDLGQESGLDLAGRVARSAGAAAPPVILISTYAEEDYADLIADSPAIGYLPKATLSATAIRRLLDERTDAPPGPVAGPPER